MKQNDLISVLVPVYNVEKYVKEAIQSLLNQTYQNLEIIIVDDCSTDKTFEILENLKKQDNRIKIFRNYENKKICYSLNKAFLESSGNYIARMDGDDVSLPNKIEEQLKYLKKNRDVDLVGTSTILINDIGEKIGEDKFISKFEDLKKILKINTPVSHIWLAKREVYERLKGYRELPYVEDYDFLLRMITEGMKFTNISEFYGYKVRVRNGNTGSTVGIKQRKAFEYVFNLYEQRLEKGVDFYNIKEFYEYITPNKKEEKEYMKSYNFLIKSINLKSEKNFLWIYYFFKSFIISKYQKKYILNRIKYRIIRKMIDIGVKI